MSTAVIGTYAIGRGGTGLESNWSYVLPATLGALWLAVGLNIVGLKTGRWLQNLGALGHLPAGRRAGRARRVRGADPAAGHADDAGHAAARSRRHGRSSICGPRSPSPSPGWSSARCWATRCKNPRRNLPRSIYISAPLIAFLYIAGTASLLWLVPSSEVQHRLRLPPGARRGRARRRRGLAWLAPAAAALYVLGNIGGIGAWLTGPARVAFVIGLDRYFPPAFGRVHPRWQTPYVAILTQAVLASLFLLVSVLGHGTTVERAYLVMLDTMLLVYFMPYIYLFLCYLADRLRRDEPRRFGFRARAKAGGRRPQRPGADPVRDVHRDGSPGRTRRSPGCSALKVIGGAAAFVLLGGVVFLRGRR